MTKKTEQEIIAESIVSLAESKLQEVSFHKRTDGSSDPVFAVFHDGNSGDHLKTYDQKNGYRNVHVNDIKAVSKPVSHASPEANELVRHLTFDKDISVKPIKPKFVSEEIDTGQYPSAQDSKRYQGTDLDKAHNSISYDNTNKQVVGYHKPDGQHGKQVKKFTVPLNQASYQKVVDAVKRKHGNSAKAASAAFDAFASHPSAVNVTESVISEDHQKIDWECIDTDKKGRRATDELLEPHHRQRRYHEYVGLHTLERRNKPQEKRYQALKKLRVRDNRHAFALDQQGREV